MEKEITFLHEELKSKNTIILKDNHNNENTSIYSNNDVNITQSEKNNTQSTQSTEREREITSTERLKIMVNQSDTRPRQSNHYYTGDISSNLNDTVTSQKRGTNRKKTLIVRDAIVKISRG